MWNQNGNNYGNGYQKKPFGSIYQNMASGYQNQPYQKPYYGQRNNNQGGYNNGGNGYQKYGNNPGGGYNGGLFGNQNQATNFMNQLMIPKEVNTDGKKLNPLPANILRVADGIFLKKMDWSRLVNPNEGTRTGIVGASGSGKTKLTTQRILPHFANRGVYAICNPSEPTNRAYTPFVENGLAIHDSQDSHEVITILKRFKKRQYLACKDWRVPNSDPAEYYHDPSGLCILDDCNEDQKVFNDPIFAWFYQNSRNFKTDFFHLAQFPKTLCPKYRRNLTWLVLFAVHSPNEIKSLYAEFGGKAGSYDTFQEILKKATEDKGCLVIHQMSGSDQIQDCMFWDRNDFTKPEPYKLGAPWFRKKQQQLFDKEWELKNPVNLEDSEPKKKGAKKGAKKSEKKQVVLLDDYEE